MRRELKQTKSTTSCFLRLLLLSFLLFSLVLTACSEKDDNDPIIPTDQVPPQRASVPNYSFIMPDVSEIVTDTTIIYKDNEVQATSLENFIDKVITDSLANTDKESRRLFTYELISEDGFSPRTRNENDLTWDTFKTGFLLPNEDFRSYFDMPISTYNVKFLNEIAAYRTIIIEKADGEEVLFQLKSSSLTPTEIPNYDEELEQAISLSAFITEYVTANPQNYNYEFIALDDYAKVYDWNLMQAGYWLISSERTTFPSIADEDMENSMRKFKGLMKIRLIDNL
ncbi:MAG: hypothetical protein PHY08_05405 [Candidatus Cloacimonetes bacterium]|nr:hypothetical protein [Candidatus Cloacimonadota bacterium]